MTKKIIKKFLLFLLSDILRVTNSEIGHKRRMSSSVEGPGRWCCILHTLSVGLGQTLLIVSLVKIAWVWSYFQYSDKRAIGLKLVDSLRTFCSFKVLKKLLLGDNWLVFCTLNKKLSSFWNIVLLRWTMSVTFLEQIKVIFRAH